MFRQISKVKLLKVAHTTMLFKRACRFDCQLMWNDAE